MRTLRWSLVISVVLVLIAGGIAAGQSPGAPDPMQSGSVSIQMVQVDLVSPGVMRPDSTRTVYHNDGHRVQAIWVADDARLSGEVTAWGGQHVNRDGSMAETETYTLVNDDGRWVGHSTGLAVAQPAPDLVIGNGLLPPGPGHEDFVVFQGEGSYEGLSAIVDVDWTQTPAVVTGTIFRGDLPLAAVTGTQG